jgi:hypothetical protein
LERICNDAGFATTHKRVLTSEGNRRADLEIRNIRVAGQTDLLVDVTVRHNFQGTGHNGQTQGQLRNRALALDFLLIQQTGRRLF